MGVTISTMGISPALRDMFSTVGLFIGATEGVQAKWSKFPFIYRKQLTNIYWYKLAEFYLFLSQISVNYIVQSLLGSYFC